MVDCMSVPVQRNPLPQRCRCHCRMSYSAGRLAGPSLPGAQTLYVSSELLSSLQENPGISCAKGASMQQPPGSANRDVSWSTIRCVQIYARISLRTLLVEEHAVFQVLAAAIPRA